MLAKNTTNPDQTCLFNTRLMDIINSHHSLVVLSHKMDWNYFEKLFASCYSKKGRPAMPMHAFYGWVFAIKTHV